MSRLSSSSSDASVQPLARCGVKPAWWAVAAAFVVVLLNLAAGAAAELALVQDGQSDYRIVVAADASESVTAAAELLRDTVNESTGADLPIHELTADDRFDTESKIIVLGTNAYTDSRGLDLSGVAHDGFRLLTDGNNLFVLGRDDAGDPFSHSLFRSAGTYSGVGRLLDQHLGVRQYLPGELWHHVPKASAWTLPDLDAVHNPGFLRRKPSVSYIVGDPDRKRRAARVDEALRYARFNGAGGGLKGATQHAVAEIMKPYVKDGRYVGEREWLALVDGKRIVPSSPGHFVHWYRFHLCTSDPDVRRITADYVLDFFKNNPDYDVCGIGMTDGDRHCECADCRALDAPGSDSLTDRYLDFAAHVAREVKKTHPDKLVGTYIYATYVNPPLREHDLPDNLYFAHVQNGTYYFSERERQASFDRMDKWSDLSDHIAFYSWPASHGFFSLPLSDPEWVVEHLRAMQQYGYLGYESYVSGAPAARQPDTYLLLRMLWDMDRDPQAILDGFYTDLYGDAAEPVRDYHRTITEQARKVNESIVMVKDRSDDTVSRFEDRLLAYYVPIMDACRSLLDTAAGRVADDDLRSRRVDVLSKQFKLVEMMIPAIEIGKKMDAGKASEEELARLDRLRIEYHQFLREHAYSDVVDVRDISYVPGTGRDDLKRYLLIPIKLEEVIDVPIEERPDAQWGGLAFEYKPPAEAEAAPTLLTLPETWAFRTDPEQVGTDEGWATQTPGDGWRDIKVTEAWNHQGVDHRGVAWYSTTFRAPDSLEPGRPLWLYFGAVDGKVKVYLDGQPVGEQAGPTLSMWDKPWAVDISEAVTAGETHRLALRVEKHENAGAVGVWKPVELRQAAAARASSSPKDR